MKLDTTEEGEKTGMSKEKIRDERFTLKNRFRYRFDNRMAKGSLGFIRILIAASVLLAVLISGLIILFGFNEEGEVASVFWDGIATVINAWMPYYADGSPGYLILMSVIAIAGVLFTSVLIGIITSAIEEKLDNLKRGNSLVLEKGHTVVLGFNPGEFALLEQLILAAAGRPACVVIAEDADRWEMEQSIAENLDVPKNFRIVCRTADVTDPASLEKCSVETCRTVIVTPGDDLKTIKAVLAVTALLEEKGVPEIRVNAVLSKSAYTFPPSVSQANNIATFQTNSILAKMIAHSCTQTGLAKTFSEVFNFEGAEWYLIDLPLPEGATFENISAGMSEATPVGVYRGGKVILAPEAGFVLEGTDRILVFSEDREAAKLVAASADGQTDVGAAQTAPEAVTQAVIIGCNETLPVVLAELPENVARVYLSGETAGREREAAESVAAKRGLELSYYDGDPSSEQTLLGIARTAEHIIVLNDHERDVEEADMEAVFLLLNLRDIRKRYGLRFNITVELQKERNQKLVGRGDDTDFLVSSSMSSLILAQLAENPELTDVFREILSNEGKELFLKNVSQLRLEGTRSVRSLRRVLLRMGYVFLGVTDAGENSRFNPPLDEEITLAADDGVIVLGEK